MYLSKYISETYLDEKAFRSLDILESCYDALHEGVDVIDIARNNGTSMVISYLDTAQSNLLRMHELLNQYMNNFILNYAKLAEKYRDLILQMYSRITDPISYKTFTYPKLRNLYPSSINLRREWLSYVGDARLFGTESPEEQKDVKTYFNYKTDTYLIQFTQDFLGTKLSPDSLESSTKLVVSNKIKGPVKPVIITEKNIIPIIDEIVQSTKDMQKEMRTIKSAIVKDYKTLLTLVDQHDVRKVGASETLKMKINPEKYTLQTADLERFSDINLEINRMLIGFSTVYATAHSTKMKVYKERLDINRDAINRVLQAAGAFAAINNKTATKQSGPLKRTDEMDLFKF